jgi:UDP-N-acetylglucosamine 2-epimerase (non-hydrolysing)
MWRYERHDSVSTWRLDVAAVVGTRPEAIKMAPVIKALQAADWCKCIVVATAQHRQMLDQVLELFGIKVDIDLDVMCERQTLPLLTSRLFERLDGVYVEHKPDLVLAQGDTTTVMVAAMTAFYHRIPFGHVEAGLRTGDPQNPFPEEMNRVVAGRLAALHFAPTSTAADALRREGVPEADIAVTGNTVIDALLEVAAKSHDLPLTLPRGQRVILLTAHRRENFGAPYERILAAVNRLIARYPDIEVVYPLHPNPNVKTMAHQRLGRTHRVHLLQPLDYHHLVAVMKASTLVLTDSGGIQEEAPALGKPVLVLREETERPEAVEAGVAKLVGTDEDAIVSETARLLDEESAYRHMAQSISPYGDGKAASRIVALIKERYSRGR